MDCLIEVTSFVRFPPREVRFSNFREIQRSLDENSENRASCPVCTVFCGLMILTGLPTCPTTERHNAST